MIKVVSTSERQRQLRKRRKKLGQKRRDLFLTDIEYKYVKEFVRDLRRDFEPIYRNEVVVPEDCMRSAIGNRRAVEPRETTDVCERSGDIYREAAPGETITCPGCGKTVTLRTDIHATQIPRHLKRSPEEPTATRVNTP